MGRTRERAWLRPLGLLVLSVAFAVGQPVVLIATTFGVLTFLAPGGGLGVLALAAVGVALAFSGEPAGGLWYMERAWAILVAGGFGAATLAWPERSFFPRALLAVGGGAGAATLMLGVMEGWPTVDALMMERLQAGAAATLDTMLPLVGGEMEGGVSEAVARTVGLQATLFPALFGLGSLAALGVGWWVYVRLAVRSNGGLGPLREFRFADSMVWVLVAGVTLVLLAGWGVGWGRLGANLLVFMAGLYTLRGAGVALFLLGGGSTTTTVLLWGAIALGFVVAGPLLLTGAMVVGLGDTWLDIRARLRPGDGPGQT